jgi:hypothetical protein
MKETTESCGCCEGVEKLTPLPTANRPGLDALRYRVGTHATFLETMLARLSSLCLGSEDECNVGAGRYPLQNLKTREGSDPAIALLDAWATVADVLSFYQERIANEGYLRTATERRSVLELARLVGYQPRPGIASSVYLAYTLDENFKDEVVIPRGARSQSVPGPGEMPQSFETGEDLKARARWNNLRPRMTQPQTKGSILRGDGSNQHVYLKGISTNLKPNDPLLIDFLGNDKLEDMKFHRVKEVITNAAANRTLVVLHEAKESTGERGNNESRKIELPDVSLIKSLTLRPSVQPRNSLRLSRGLKEQFTPKAETGYAAMSAFAPVLRETLATAKSNAQVTEENPVKVYALRTKASLFGHNHPGTPKYGKDPDNARMIKIDSYTPPNISTVWTSIVRGDEEELGTIAIDPSDEQVKPESWLVIERPVKFEETTDDHTGEKICKVTDWSNWTHSIHHVKDARQVTLSALGASAKVGLLSINKPWKIENWIQCEALLRDTTVYARSEELELAEEPIEALVCRGAEEPIELDGFYEGLGAGRWVVVSGERDISGTSGVRFSELAMLSGVEHRFKKELPGDRIHTFIKLAEKLQYCFKRDTVTIYGNVVKASHGETRKEVLGSGDGAKALQAFNLKQPPLTFISANNPSGVDSTLKVYVNDVQWHETDSLAGLSLTDRRFFTKTDDDGKTTVIFGNGREGARLPTGTENIKAEYRNGIGKLGNVKADQITLLATRPLGVKEVFNPLRASGGADKESRDQARKNAPLAVTALDRLVSVQDYEDFARSYAGIGKACATEVSNGRRQVVHVTIAGADDIPIDETSDLFINLRQALHDFGDPFLPIQLTVRELMFIVISARVRILPDYQWEPVVMQLRQTLLDAFGFERRELGQDVLLSKVTSVMQGVRGVAYVDVDLLRGIPEKIPDTEHPGQRRLLTPDEIARRVTEPLKDEDGKPLTDESGNILKEPLSRIRVNLADYEEGIIRPAQLAFMTPDVPATLILNQIP